MLGGREMFGMEDKSVSTSDDFLQDHIANNGDHYEEQIHWNILTVEKLLTVLINTKLMSIREMMAVDSEGERSSYSYWDDFKEKEPPDKKSYHDRTHRSPHHHRHQYRCSKHYQQDEQQQRSSISKVQKWSDDLYMETTFETEFPDEEISRERIAEGRIRTLKDRCTVLELDSRSPPKRKKRRKRKRQGKRIKKMSHIDPEDLPKRARWTIIITSGLLILTCMLLVGITLRMAPVIDQMVQTKNEELMNSLNRNTNPAYYSSIGTG